jgi:hypothetical protein
MYTTTIGSSLSPPQVIGSYRANPQGPPPSTKSTFTDAANLMKEVYERVNVNSANGAQYIKDRDATFEIIKAATARGKKFFSIPSHFHWKVQEELSQDFFLTPDLENKNTIKVILKK